MIKLPAILNPISRRKDKSVKLSFETREMSPQEIMTLLAMEGSEGHLLYAPNTENLDDSDVPNVKAVVDTKSPSERLMAVIFVHFKQATKEAKYVGIFDAFYKEQMDRIIEGYKIKNLHESN